MDGRYREDVEWRAIEGNGHKQVEGRVCVARMDVISWLRLGILLLSSLTLTA